MPNIIVYSTAQCPYCVRAKRLLERKGASYREIPVDADEAKRKEMEIRSGRRTVPQIFIDDYHVGGFDDLAALDAEGKLEPLLNA